ncbi:MAG: SIMPL domain-containing protein, partial [Pseudomonadales bacterium]|nr:SIMPL domain-containing protein [Pseudomonadales bacterium]
ITSNTMTIGTAERYDQFDHPIPAGHMAYREINLLLRDVTSYSRILQVLVDVGVTRVVNVRAEVSDLEGTRLKVLAQAGKDARTKAEYLASELGASLGRVHRIGDPSVTDRFGRIEEVVVSASKVSAPAPYEFKPGTVTVRATLYVEFELE